MNKHAWKFRWLVDENDLTEVEAWSEDAILRLSKTFRLKGVIGKTKLLENSGLVVTFPVMDVVDAYGRVMEVSATTSDFSVDENSVSTDPSGGKERWVVLAVEYEVDATNPKTDPVTGNPFDFHLLDDYKLRVVAGVEATPGNAVPPTVGDGIVVGGVVLSSGQSTITQANLDDGEDDLLHVHNAMWRGALELFDTTYLETYLGSLTGVETAQELYEVIAAKAKQNETDLTDHEGDTANPHSVTAVQVETVTTSFDGQLSAADDTTQKALDTLDDHLHDDRYYTESEVDVLIDATLKPPEAYDPASSGNFPTTYGGNPVQQGDSFRIVTADTLGTGTIVNPEDLLIALIDTPGQTDANWLVVESNRDQATETIKGVAKIATQAIADAGVNDTDFITALKAATRYLALTGGTMTGILNLVSASKVLELAIAEWGGRIIFEASTTGTGIPYDDFYIGQYADSFRIYQAGGAGNQEYDGQTGELTIPAAGDFKLGGGASLKAHPHTGASDGGQIDTAGIVDDAVTADKLSDHATIDANRAVTTDHIRDLAVTEAKIAALAVTPAKLNVAGGENYHYESVKTLHYTIGPGDFITHYDGDDTNVKVTGARITARLGDPVTLYAMLRLPNGCTVVAAEMGYTGWATGRTVLIRVHTVTKIDGAAAAAFIDIAGTVAAYQQKSQTGITELIDNNAKYYYVALTLDGDGVGETVYFYYLEIEYEMTNLLPVG